MDEELKNTLQEGEKVLWEGKPENFITLDNTNKKPFIIKVVITAVVCIALIVAYCAATIPLDNFKPALPIVIAAFGILIASGTFLDARKLRRQRYYITDRRLIWISDSTRSVPYETIQEYLFSRDEDDHMTLLVGVNAVKKKSHKWRSMAAGSVFMNDDTGVCEQAVFYAIPRAEQFKKIFEEQLQKHQK